ncbi:hypothetical protein Dimus_038872 [Dionaea muscipula]
MSSDSAHSDPNPAENIPEGVPVVQSVNIAEHAPEPAGGALHTQVLRRSFRTKKTSSPTGPSNPSDPSARPRVRGADHASTMSSVDILHLARNQDCLDYRFRAPTSSERPYDYKEGEMAMYADSLSTGTASLSYILWGYHKCVRDQSHTTDSQLLAIDGGLRCFMWPF